MWDSNSVVLGGWSLDAHQRYDVANGVLVSGDGSWRLVSPTDLPGGEHAIPAFSPHSYYAFDSNWRHVRTVDGTTGATLMTFTYDADGRLLSVRGFRSGQPVSLDVQRNADGSPRALVGMGGVTTSLAVGPDAQLREVGRPDATRLILSPDPFGLIDAWEQTGGGRTEYEFDEAGRLAKITDADGVVWSYAFTAGPDTASIKIDAEGTESEVRHERVGDVIRRSVRAPNRLTTSLETHADASAELTLPWGTHTTYGSVPDPRWGDAAPILTPFVETRSDGTVYRAETSITVTEGSGLLAGMPYEARVTVDGAAWVYSYDPPTRAFSRRDPEGRETVQVYDEQGRVTQVRLPGMPVGTYVYDELGRVASYAAATDAGNATVSVARDPASGEMAVTAADGTIANLAYDARGHPLAASVGEATHLALVRDNVGRIIQVRNGDRLSTTLGYSQAGRPTAFVPPTVGADLSYETSAYDEFGRLSTVAGPGDRSISMTYDSAGRSEAWAFDAGTVQVAFDPQTGLVDTMVAPGGVATSFDYAGVYATGLSWQGPVNGSVAVTIDPAGRVIGQAVDGQTGLSFGYDSSGALTSIGSLSIDRDDSTALPTRVVLGRVQTEKQYGSDGRFRGGADANRR